ncbi:unnamed protein product [Mytilus coruscus]|uniref:Death domain-containing protein n=1 Tax=Mytilus coruscus TaxID=42192 RepID=A0A6J8CDY0_MYTCO|nr:unnamed protein product [Mytilus coruscus]
MENLTGAQTEKLIRTLVEMRERVRLRQQEVPTTEELFLNESITNVQTYLNILSERDVLVYDKETVGIIRRLRQNLKFLSENRYTKSDFNLKMMVNGLQETLAAMLKKCRKPVESPNSPSEETVPDLDDNFSSSDFSRYVFDGFKVNRYLPAEDGRQMYRLSWTRLYHPEMDRTKKYTDIPGFVRTFRLNNSSHVFMTHQNKLIKDTRSTQIGQQKSDGNCSEITGSKYISQQKTGGKYIKRPGSTNIGQEETDGKCTDIPQSTHISQQKTNEKRTEIPGAFYDIGCGIHLYSESDVSDIIQAIRWESDDFQRFYKEDTTLQHYKLETDFFNIKPKDPKNKVIFPKDSSGMITVRVKLPNDINYQFLQLKAYIKFGQKWHMVETSLKEKSVTFQTAKIDALCIVSKPIKERVHITPNGCKYVAKTDKGIQIEFPPGAVEKDESIRLHVVPINKEILRRQYEERSKKGEAILAISDCLYTTGDTTLKKKVQVKLPLNDIRIPDESDEDYVYRLFRQNTNGQFTLTDNVVTVDENHNAVFETDKISGTSVSLIGNDELKKGPLVISSNLEKMHGYNSVCKILFFVSDVTLRSLTVLLACIEKSKMQAFCRNCEERGYRLFKNWISKDFVFKPQIKINIALKGCFSLPRFSARRRLDLTFLPNSSENFTRFVVEIKHKIDQDAYGILLLTKDKEIIDEISYNAHASLSIRRNTTDLGLVRPELTFTKESIDKQPPLPVTKYSEEDFLTDKGVMAVAKLLNSNKLFETVINLDMKQVQYDQICEKISISSRQAFTLLKTALDLQKSNKIDKLVSALESAEEGGLADSIRELYEERQDLSKIEK